MHINLEDTFFDTHTIDVRHKPMRGGPIGPVPINTIEGDKSADRLGLEGGDRGIAS